MPATVEFPMPENPSTWLTIKIAVFRWLINHAPVLRTFGREREHLLAQLAELTDQLKEVRSERDALLRGVAILLDEKVSRDRG